MRKRFTVNLSQHGENAVLMAKQESNNVRTTFMFMSLFHGNKDGIIIRRNETILRNHSELNDIG